MKNLKVIIVLVFLIGIQINLLAQENTTEQTNQSILYLNSGSTIECEIIEWKQGEYYKVQTSWDQIMLFKEDEITKIESVLDHKQLQKVYNFKEKGKYISLKGMFILGNEGPRAKGTNGFGISFSAGHRFNRLLGLGLGVGYDQFIWDSGEEMIPIFAEINGFFTPELFTGFYNIQAGYSLAFADEDYLQEEAKGGWMFYPSVGIRFGPGDQKLSLDIGYKFQEAQFTYTDIWNFSTKSQQDLVYKRLTLRFGIII